MATWAKCPDLFLYTKGSDVYLWRCNETTLLPMITEDFDDLGKVVDHHDLIGGKDSLLEWEKSSYIDLVAYISPRRLLVNSRGLVIAELGKFGQDGKMDKSDQLPFYIRSLDVLSLKPFGLRDRTIPSRTVCYLEGGGRVAPVEDSTTTSTSTELEERKRASIEKQVAELKDANKTLKNDKEAAEKQVAESKDANKSLKSDKEAAEKKVTELNERKKTLESVKEAAEKQANDLKDRNKSLAEDVAAQKTAAAKAQQGRDEAKRDKEAAERKAADLQTKIDSLAVTEMKEVWMNKFTDEVGYWNTISSLGNREFFPIVLSAEKNLFDDDIDLSTNVLPTYMHYAHLADANKVTIPLPKGTKGCYGYKAVRLDDLIPNKEKARFNILEWLHGTYNGETYAIKERFPFWSTP